ncbi:hypothetical protein ACQP1V_36265 [Microtetraspora malaysiensis]|uniref:hypothetical protein n=1 Tax=Microtetraspora malaysiensis TaxID=161358 RepID=UPI003D927EA8
MSTIPNVLDDLLQRTRLALPGVQVLDGQPVTDTEPDVVAIGFTGSPGEAAVDATEDRAQLTTSPDRERYGITCLASSWRGDTDARAVRDRVFELLAALRGELQRDPTLGGLVLSARMAVVAFAQEQTTAGPVATAQFEIRIDAFAR